MAEEASGTLGDIVDGMKIVLPQMEDGDFISHLVVLARVIDPDGESRIAIGSPDGADALVIHSLVRLSALQIEFDALGVSPDAS